MSEVLSESLSREIQRIRAFLLFSSELSCVHFTRKSSFNALFKAREIKTKTQLKSLNNLYLSSREFHPTIVKRLEELIEWSRDSQHVSQELVAILTFNLFSLQSREDNNRSQFRELALQLSLSLDSKAFLQFCHLLGKKRINSSKSVRKAIQRYYSRDLSEKQEEDTLLFKRYQDWSHRDLIRLCHVTPNPLTEKIMRARDSELETLSAVEKRVRVLRCEKSRDHELAKALDESHVESIDWFFAINTIHSRNAFLRRKTIFHLKDNDLLKTICLLVTRFPNNKSLFQELINALKNCSKVSKVLKNFILFFLKNHSMNSLKATLETTIQLMDTQDEDLGSVVVIVDKDVDLQRLYLRDLKDKKRRKSDLMDKMLLKDFFVLFFSSFSGLLTLEEGLGVVPLDTNGPISGHQLEDIPVEVLRGRHVIYLSEREIDLNVWKSCEKKLIVCHFNRLEIKNLGFFQTNALILNGFDFIWEQNIKNFLKIC